MINISVPQVPGLQRAALRLRMLQGGPFVAGLSPYLNLVDDISAYVRSPAFSYVSVDISTAAKAVLTVAAMHLYHLYYVRVGATVGTSFLAIQPAATSGSYSQVGNNNLRITLAGTAEKVQTYPGGLIVRSGDVVNLAGGGVGDTAIEAVIYYEDELLY